MQVNWSDWRRALRSAPLPIAPYGRRALAAIFIRQTGINLVVVAFVFALSLPLLIGYLPYRLDLIWAAAFGLMILISSQRYLRASGRSISLATADRLFRNAPRQAAIVGTMWGITAFFVPYLPPAHQVAVPLLGIGLCVGATATLSAAPRAARAYLLCTILPYVLLYATRATLPHLILSMVASVLLLALLHATQLGHRSLITALRARRAADEAQLQLEEAKAQWRQLSESAEAFALYGADGRLLLWNDAYRALTSLAPGAMHEGLSWRLIDAACGGEALPEMQWLGQASSTREAHETIEGHVGGRWLRSSLRRLADGRFAVSHVDITELKDREARLVALQDELRAARDAAESASEAKSRFLANMSHELRTPLNAVIGFADLMSQDHGRRQVDLARHENYARLISDSGHHLLGIVEDMLDLARIESGKMMLAESDCDLVDLVRSAARIALGRQPEQGVTLVEDYPPMPIRMRLDLRLTRQALINLLGNAIKFSNGSGKIWLRVQHANDGVGITVEDEGVGIPGDRLADVMEPFSQVESGEARRFGGVGLGLPLARQFIELQGGRLELGSREGPGTRATLWLPAERLQPNAN